MKASGGVTRKTTLRPVVRCSSALTLRDGASSAGSCSSAGGDAGAGRSGAGTGARGFGRVGAGTGGAGDCTRPGSPGGGTEVRLSFGRLVPGTDAGAGAWRCVVLEVLGEPGAVGRWSAGGELGGAL